MSKTYGYDIGRPVLINTEYAHNQEGNLDKVRNDRSPHKSKEIEDLSLHD